MPFGYYDMYIAGFEHDGIAHQIVAEQIEAEELVKVVSSIICGEEGPLIRNPCRGTLLRKRAIVELGGPFPCR